MPSQKSRTPTLPAAEPGRSSPASGGVLAPPALSDLLRVLADPTRLEILECLARCEDSLCVCHLESCVDISQPTVSHHLKVMRDSGLVDFERRGTWMHYRLRREAFAALGDFLARVGVSAGGTSSSGVNSSTGVNPRIVSPRRSSRGATKGRAK